jgi:hypothetical protein
MSSKEKRFPPIWPLLFIAALSFLLGNIELSREPEINEFIRVLVPFSGLCYWLYCVRRFHLAVVDVPGWNHPISPAQAVWLHLIPLYNFYWIFKWPAELANFVKWKTGSKAMGKYEVGIMLLIGGILGRMHASIALGFLFITAKYIEASLEKAFAITSNDQQ